MTIRGRRSRTRVPSGRPSLDEVKTACQLFACDTDGQPLDDDIQQIEEDGQYTIDFEEELEDGQDDDE